MACRRGAALSLLLDANLLIYGTLPAMPEHGPTRAWLVERLEDPGELVGLAWPALYAMVRVVTSRRIMGAEAVTLPAAWEAATAYLEQDNTHLVEAGPLHNAIAGELLQTPGLQSEDVPDVHLAALAIEHGLILCSHDHGFARFPRLTWQDPLTA